jgi:hypothetical protein
MPSAGGSLSLCPSKFYILEEKNRKSNREKHKLHSLSLDWRRKRKSFKSV